jgi:hypothetical protein
LDFPKADTTTVNEDKFAAVALTVQKIARLLLAGSGLQMSQGLRSHHGNANPAMNAIMRRTPPSISSSQTIAITERRLAFS